MNKIREKHILTVTGPVNLKKLGIIDAHSHVWIQKVKNCNCNSNFIIDNFSLIKKELIEYKDIGGSSIVDCQPWGCGRNGNKLYQLSKKTGVNIVAVTGFYKREYYSINNKIWKMNKKQATRFFIDEIEIGLNETLNKRNNIRAGLIKIGFIGELKEEYLTLTKAAVDAALETGLSITVHTEKGRNVELLIKFLEAQELPLSRVLLCHIDKRNDIDLHKSLANKSISLEYDTFFREKYNPKENVWLLLTQMVEDGYHTNIMIGSDIAEPYIWYQDKKINYSRFLQNIKKRMSKINISKDAVDNMISINAAKFLCINK